VRVVEPLGPHTLITASVAGVVMRAVLDSTLALATGDRITLSPVADRIRWFDLATQKAIA